MKAFLLPLIGVAALCGVGTAHAKTDDDAGNCARAAAVLAPTGNKAQQTKDCACLTPKLRASLIPDDYAYRAEVNALIAEGTTNVIDFQDEILGFLQTHYRTGPSAADAPARIDKALAAAQKACGIAPQP